MIFILPFSLEHLHNSGVDLTVTQATFNWSRYFQISHNTLLKTNFSGGRKTQNFCKVMPKQSVYIIVNPGGGEWRRVKVATENEDIVPAFCACHHRLI